MQAPPGGEFESFDDLFGPNFFTSPLQLPEHGDYVPFHTLDRILVLPSPQEGSVLVILRDSRFLKAPGYGCAMTVSETSQVIAMLRKCIARVEDVPEQPPHAQEPRFVDEDEPYD